MSRPPRPGPPPPPQSSPPPPSPQPAAAAAARRPSSSGRRRGAALRCLRPGLGRGPRRSRPPAPGPRPRPPRHGAPAAAAPRAAGLGPCGRPPAATMGPLLRRLLLAALLPLARAQAPGSQREVPSHQKKVVSWLDVYARATCQPRDVVVPLNMELLGTVAKQLVPSCVTVQRCGGCCPDEALECVPTGQYRVRMQILMIHYPSSQLGEMSLEEHSQCECSPRLLCPRCPQRHQRPDPRTCRCRCPRRSLLRCQGRGLELNPRTCRCRKLRR
ncbi:vascular endothelial growth factor B isoform X4 [Erinaceus europaeus]|uniref:Vascular endothelial growth factor B isoform X4 n=1 Tax=Erinaceus europaeus TaxID=9365 RepID=A0A1S3W6V2_ERIEU|nr:vascular endothelial growth factor B isoform X4 [Erinaceus europaeus]